MWFFRQTFRTLLFILAALALPAVAGEFYERNGAAVAGHDVVAYFSEGKPVQGSAAFTHAHKGSTFQFASAANRDAFAANPDRYAPQYGGFCAYGLTRGYKAKVDPASFAVVDGKLYLNYNADVQKLWAKDTAGFIKTANAKWPEVSRTTKVIE